MTSRPPRVASLCLVAILMSLTSCGGQSPAPAPTPTPPASSGNTNPNVTINIVGNSGSQAFSPNPASVPAGQTVQFRNTTGSTHRIVADNGAWDAGTISSGNASPIITITVATPAPFHCTIHGSMMGTINQ